MIEALIYSPEKTEIIGRCQGPDRSGGCPNARSGGPAMCAGRPIVPVGPAFGTSGRFSIPSNAETCPLASLAVRALAGFV